MGSGWADDLEESVEAAFRAAISGQQRLYAATGKFPVQARRKAERNVERWARLKYGLEVSLDTKKRRGTNEYDLYVTVGLGEPSPFWPYG
jgi:hypothetical protein